MEVSIWLILHNISLNHCYGVFFCHKITIVVSIYFGLLDFTKVQIAASCFSHLQSYQQFSGHSTIQIYGTVAIKERLVLHFIDLGENSNSLQLKKQWALLCVLFINKITCHYKCKQIKKMIPIYFNNSNSKEIFTHIVYRTTLAP